MMKMLFVVFASVIFCFLYTNSNSQTTLRKSSFSNADNIEKDKTLTDEQKIAAFYKIKKNYESGLFVKDSSYALLLLKIAKYEILINNNADLSIQFTNQAIRLNQTIHSPHLNFLSNYNLALYYDHQFSYSKALDFCDSTIAYCKKNNDTNNYELNAHWLKANIYLGIGDYQKTIDESNFGISISLHKNDTENHVNFLNRKAVALFYENNLRESLKNAQAAIFLNRKDLFEYSLSYKTIGKIYQNKKQLDSALLFYKKNKNYSELLNSSFLLAYDYNDLGNFYLDATHEYDLASACYFKTIKYANKITDVKTAFLLKSFAYNNLCETSLKQHNITKAEKFILLAFSHAGLPSDNILTPNFSKQFNLIADKGQATFLLFNKINLLLQKYKSTRQNVYLNACVKTAFVSDSVITIIRHEQLGEESKLYWRDRTRELYTNAIEACYLDNNAASAFYFMEKSRAALLNDKLNELGASLYLPLTESKEQETYQIKIVELEQKLSLLNDTSKQFQNIQFQLLNAKNDFEQYIKSLEIKYPQYYQYKYEDNVEALNTLQKYLVKNNQSFVDYFIDDSTSYALAITGTSTKFIQLSHNQFNKNDLLNFLKICSNKELLNNNYAAFASLSNSIYKKLFLPLNLPKGKIVICTDNIVIPFDALCIDETGKNFLLNNYSFIYVYSAGYLMKHFNAAKPTGNFIGFAPVSFASYLNVNDLKNAAEALNASSSFYNNNKLFFNQNATRKNFFKYASSYSVVSIFSHARADTTDNEPVLFMQDSLIRLSELQLLNKPATQLVLLSACQTNVGKTAAGEGIYSLARGFALAGIPSVSATLWKADEATIYIISEAFNKNLSEGMYKDEALQKAKIDFIKNNSNEKLLPYYWANMILIGNTDAIQLKTTNTNYLWLILLVVALTATAIILLIRRKKVKSKF